MLKLCDGCIDKYLKEGAEIVACDTCHLVQYMIDSHADEKEFSYIVRKIAECEKKGIKYLLERR